jgi:hypothetical protein
MFEVIDFESSINSLKIKWIDNNLLSRYALSLLPFIWIIVSIFLIVTTGSLQSVLSLPTGFLISLPITFVLFIFSLYFIHQNDKLIKVPFIEHPFELRKLIEKEIIQSGWKVRRSNPKFLTAHKTGKWLAGSKMAILFHNKSVFINVQNLDGFRGYFPFSFGRNKRATDKLILFIKNNFTAPSGSLAENPKI